MFHDSFCVIHRMGSYLWALSPGIHRRAYSPLDKHRHHDMDVIINSYRSENTRA